MDILTPFRITDVPVRCSAVLPYAHPFDPREPRTLPEPCAVPASKVEEARQAGLEERAVALSRLLKVAPDGFAPLFWTLYRLDVDIMRHMRGRAAARAALLIYQAEHGERS